MAKKATHPTNFGSLAGNMLSNEQPQAEQTDATANKVTSFALDADLKQPLDRVAYHSGRKGSQRKVINDALRYYFANDPVASANAAKRMPDE